MSKAGHVLTESIMRVARTADGLDPALAAAAAEGCINCILDAGFGQG